MWEKFSDANDQQLRDARKDPDCDSERGGEDQSPGQCLRLRNGEAGDAGHDQPINEPENWIAFRRARFHVDIRPKNAQRRQAPKPQKRRQRKQDADRKSKQNAADDWLPGDRGRNRERQECFQDARKDTLHGNTQSCARSRAHQTHRRGLKQVNEHRSARRHSETAQNRARPGFLLKVRLNRTGHADRAEQERDEANEIQKAVEIFQRRPEILLALGDGVIFETKPLDLRRKNLDPLPHIGPVGELHVIAIVRDAARFQEVRLRRDFAAECKRAAQTTPPPKLRPASSSARPRW